MVDKFLMEFRREYLSGDLLEENVLESPYQQFMDWMEDAIRSGINDPTAMALATADASGRPSVRIVLLKDARPEGFVFFSNYESRKGNDLDSNPQASVMFFWPGLERQVRIAGSVEKTDKEESDEFFDSRPVKSRISSIISPQSNEIRGRKYLNDKFNILNDLTDNDLIKRPDNWGGYILIPHEYEFWQGRENRLNDRIQYVLEGNTWVIKRLAP